MPGEADSSRRSIRLKQYDYSQVGSYFFTICAHHRQMLFAEIRDEQMKCNRSEEAVWSVWRGLPARFPMLELDEFVVMPNHVHGILRLNPVTRTGLWPAGAASSAPTNATPPSPTLGRILRRFKSVSAIAVNRVRNRTGAPVWQRNYYEHIIRRSEDLDEVRAYIAGNPAQWPSDRENPRAESSLKTGKDSIAWLR